MYIPFCLNRFFAIYIVQKGTVKYVSCEVLENRILVLKKVLEGPWFELHVVCMNPELVIVRLPHYSKPLWIYVMWAGSFSWESGLLSAHGKNRTFFSEESVAEMPWERCPTHQPAGNNILYVLIVLFSILFYNSCQVLLYKSRFLCGRLHTHIPDPFFCVLCHL